MYHNVSNNVVDIRDILNLKYKIRSFTCPCKSYIKCWYYNPVGRQSEDVVLLVDRHVKAVNLVTYARLTEILQGLFIILRYSILILEQSSILRGFALLPHFNTSPTSLFLFLFRDSVVDKDRKD